MHGYINKLINFSSIKHGLCKKKVTTLSNCNEKCNNVQYNNNFEWPTSFFINYCLNSKEKVRILHKNVKKLKIMFKQNIFLNIVYRIV